MVLLMPEVKILLAACHLLLILPVLAQILQMVAVVEALSYFDYSYQNVPLPSRLVSNIFIESKILSYDAY